MVRNGRELYLRIYVDPQDTKEEYVKVEANHTILRLKDDYFINEGKTLLAKKGDEFLVTQVVSLLNYDAFMDGQYVNCHLSCAFEERRTEKMHIGDLVMR